jgi:hypothetical protein
MQFTGFTDRSTAAPQVLQGTDRICFGVSSFVFTTTSCTFPIRENAQY